MEKRYQVFVSSTFADLQEERQEIIQALLELDCIPAGMELFPAADDDQWTLIKKVIDDCDYYIVVIGGRYGSLSPSGVSYTQMEYEYAVSQGKPVIAFLHKKPGSIPSDKAEQTGEGRRKLEAFRALAQKKMCKYWSSPAELGSIVSRSLVKLIQDKPAVGWVRANSLLGETASKSLPPRRETQLVASPPVVSNHIAPKVHELSVDAQRSVFVVHGRNLEARNSLFRFLRSIGLRPLEWWQAIKATGKASPFIGEVLDVAFSKAQAIVVLLTPDDEARLREHLRDSKEPAYEAELTGQARPNVLFEAGMSMGRNPDRTIIVELGTLRPFSDIAGRHTVRLSNDSAARQELAQRLETAGCAVDLSGRDWHTEGDFNLSSTATSKSRTLDKNGSEQLHNIQVNYISQALRAGSIYPVAEELLQHLRELQTAIQQLGRGVEADSLFSEEFNHLQGEINGLYKLSGSDIASHMILKKAQALLFDLRGIPSYTEAPEAIDEESDENEDSELSLVLKTAREVRITNRQRQWRTSEEGVSAARQEVDTLYASLGRRVKKAKEKLAADKAPINIDLSKENNDHFILSSGPYNLSIIWDCKSTGTLEGSVLSIRGYKKELEDEQFYSAEYEIEMNRDLLVGWRRREQRDRFMPTDSLARELFEYLVLHIRSKAMYGE